MGQVVGVEERQSAEHLPQEQPHLGFRERHGLIQETLQVPTHGTARRGRDISDGEGTHIGKGIVEMKDTRTERDGEMGAIQEKKKKSVEIMKRRIERENRERRKKERKMDLLKLGKTY